MASRILVDSGFLYALYDLSDQNYSAAAAFTLTDLSLRIIPDVVLTEVVYLLKQRVGQRATLAFLDDLAISQAQLEPVLIEDIRRVTEIMEDYADADLDFVDCCIVALAERLAITQISTFDRRDFQMIRPSHAPYFELLP